jgi:DNA-binding protein H-NS
MNLSKLSLDTLVALRDEIDKLLKKKSAEERSINVRSPLRGSVVAPKYRNPENPSETWAGRGLKPRWLTAALKGGRELEHFAIAAWSKTAAVKRSPGKTTSNAK